MSAEEKVVELTALKLDHPTAEDPRGGRTMSETTAEMRKRHEAERNALDTKHYADRDALYAKHQRERDAIAARHAKERGEAKP